MWLARNVTGSFRAVKIVRRSKFQNDAPFEREYRGLRHFEPVSREHAGLVDILQVGRDDDDGLFFYVMEAADDAVAGCAIDPDRYTPLTLGHKLRTTQRLPTAECLEAALALADALNFLHSAGLVHRDVKPSNIIFIDGVPKLADIGSVTPAESAQTFCGSPGYAAPEGPGSKRSDVYSLGKVLHEMAMGRDSAVRSSQSSTPKNDIDRTFIGLEQIASKACHQNTRRRHADAADLLAELRLLEAGRSVSAHRLGRQILQATTGTALILAVTGIIAAAIHRFAPPPPANLPLTEFVRQTPNDDVVIESEQSGSHQVWTTDRGSPALVRLTWHTSQSSAPFPSPDGCWIAYTGDTSGESEIRVMDAQGEHDKPMPVLSENLLLNSLEGWMPDSRRVLFLAEDTNGSQLAWTVDRLRTGIAMFMDPRVGGWTRFWSMRFSADGRRVVWSGQTGAHPRTAEIYVADLVEDTVQTNTIVQVTHNDAWDGGAVLGPDGNSVAFLRTSNPSGIVYPFRAFIQQLAGPGDDSRGRVRLPPEHRLAAFLQDVQSLEWSPGPQLLFSALNPGVSLRQVFSVAPNGSNLVCLTPPKHDTFCARWRQRSPTHDRSLDVYFPEGKNDIRGENLIRPRPGGGALSDSRVGRSN